MYPLKRLTACVAGLVLLGGSAPAQEAQTKQPATVTASATARVYRSPDYLDVTFGVVILKPTAGEAQTTASTTMESALKAVKALNLSGAEYQTGSVDLSPQYNDYRDMAERRIVAYRATNTVRVRTTDLSAAAKLIDAATKAGANSVDSVEFGLKEHLAAREEAIGQAAKAAARKASVLAESLHVQCGKIVNVSESSPTYGYWSRAAQVQSNVSFEGAPPPGEGAFEPGKVEVSVTVTLVCEIAPQ
ncbi:MAG: SIMPL domain-containing protein [Planctomycetes bacterium]|nr:SIMPL domain-containing protein [Planctomycetota bacterium]